MLGAGKLKPILYDAEYNGLERVAAGLQDLEGRKMWGKGVVRIRPSVGAQKREAKL